MAGHTRSIKSSSASLSPPRIPDPALRFRSCPSLRGNTWGVFHSSLFYPQSCKTYQNLCNRCRWSARKIDGTKNASRLFCPPSPPSIFQHTSISLFLLTIFVFTFQTLSRIIANHWKGDTHYSSFGAQTPLRRFYNGRSHEKVRNGQSGDVQSGAPVNSACLGRFPQPSQEGLAECSCRSLHERYREPAGLCAPVRFIL